jgi:hypothetical protein
MTTIFLAGGARKPTALAVESETMTMGPLRPAQWSVRLAPPGVLEATGSVKGSTPGYHRLLRSNLKPAPDVTIRQEGLSTMKRVVTVLTLAFVLAISTSARADEPAVVNVILAQVNNDVITLADYKRALQPFREELKLQMPGKSDAEIDTELERLKGDVLDSLIDDLLLEQRAKELGLDGDVDAEVNREMLRVAKEMNLKHIDELKNELRTEGLDFEDVRSDLRKYFQRQLVLEREVLQPVTSRFAMTEQDEVVRKQYVKKLRDAAFIKISGTPARLVSARNWRNEGRSGAARAELICSDPYRAVATFSQI